MKHNLISFVIITIINYILTSGETAFKSRKSGAKSGAHAHTEPAKGRPVNLNIADAQVYYQGWVKYYHYDNDTHYKKPPSLFQNNAFFNQRIPKDKKWLKDNFGLKRIPDKASFFLVLYNNSLSLYAQRKEMVAHLVDSLKIAYIRVIPEDNVLKGGVRDDGNFNFGFCIEAQADIPPAYKEVKTPGVGMPETWIFCTSKGEDKDNLLSTLIKLKVKHQRLENNGMKTTMKKMAPPGLGGLIAKPNQDNNEQKGQTMNKITDGYWILLNDWTACSMKCGNGTSYQQWMCVPPKMGGKPCVGEVVRKKHCNDHACPSVVSLVTLINEKKGKPEIAPKPIVKAGVFSNRPQRYSKCIIKENDAFILTDVPGSPELVRKPMRILMNNMTISIFNDDTYQELFYTYDLQRTTFTTKTTFCCFGLQDNWKKSEICGYNENCGPKTKNIWVDDWSADFRLFKVQCKTNLPITELLGNVIVDQQVEKEMEEKAALIVDQEENNAAGEQAILVKKEVLRQTKRQYAKKKKSVEDLSFSVIGKEIQLENMVKHEETTKEEQEQDVIQKQIAKEEYKSECLEKSFEERELDDEFVESAKSSQADIDEVKQQAVKKITQGRVKLKRSIQLMKVKAKTRNANLATKLQQIRSKMSKEIMLANRNGDVEKCNKGKVEVDYRQTYCNENFVDDWMRNSDCKGAEFCYVCCETEFGAMFVNQRDSCYKMCDYKKKVPIPEVPVNVKALRADLVKTPEAPVDDQSGKWVWAPKEVSTNGANAMADATK